MNLQPILTFLLTIIVFVCIVNLLTVIIHKYTYKVSAISPFNTCSFNEFPLSLKPFFESNSDCFSRIGFKHVSYFKSNQEIGNINTFFYLLANWSDRVFAIIVSMHYCTDKSYNNGNQYIEFVSKTIDDEEICTNNSHFKSVQTTIPNRFIFKFPNIQDPEKLFVEHKKKVSEVFHEKEQFFPPDESCLINELLSGFNKECNQRILKGEMKLVKDGRYFVPTWKGAIISAINGFYNFQWLKKK